MTTVEDLAVEAALVDAAVIAPVPVQLSSRLHSMSKVAPSGIGERGPELLPLDAGEQYRFGFDMNACIGCHSCEVACAEQNGLPAGTTWRRVGEVEGGEHPETRRWNISMSCNHCLEPACLDGCPTNAYVKLDNGVVAHHADDCIGCQYCTWNCPYSVPAFQPDRRIVSKCDMCQPRLSEGLAPACVTACPTNAITIEKVNVEEWRADHAAGDAPELPSVELTLSTTRFELPPDIPTGTSAASDWNLRPEHPHWSLVWLTLLSQLAIGVSATAGDLRERLIAAVIAGMSMVGALFHLGRPIAAWKALRNLRKSWLSREVALLGTYSGLAALTVVVPAATPLTIVTGACAIFASARLYVVPGRPAWNTPLTIIRFYATALALGPTLTDRLPLAAIGIAVALAATAINWIRLGTRPELAWRGAVRLELRWFAPWTALRWTTAIVGMLGALVGWPGLVVLGILGVSELIGRWLFYVTVVPLNMPGAFWRGAAGSHR